MIGRSVEDERQDIEGARAVVRYLCNAGIEWYRNTAKSAGWTEAWNAIGGAFVAHQRLEEVDSCFLRGDAGIGMMEGEIGEPHILLQPPRGRQDVVCLLGVYWRVGTAQRQMSLYLNLFGESDDGPPWYRGYRLELPHGGRHSYTHLQPINRTGWLRRRDVEGANVRVPDDFPAFPVRGGNLTMLCVTLAVALHGKGILNRLSGLLTGNELQGEVRSFLRDH